MTSQNLHARPSRVEFLARRQRLQRFMQFGNIGAIVLGVVGALVVLVMLKQSGARIGSDWISISFMASFLPFFFAGVVAVKSYGRRYGASCPACNTPLIGALGQIAVASGRCGKCGEVVCD